MIKFTADLDRGRLYGFGLTEADLNRLQFNREALFFDFGYAGNPELFGLIVYLEEFEVPPVESGDAIAAIEMCCLSFLDPERGVTLDTLVVFPIARSVMQKFRETLYWGFPANVRVAHPEDRQLFFAGPSEQDIEKYFRAAGFITPRTKRTHKGFGSN